MNFEDFVKSHGMSYELEIKLKAPNQNTMNKNSFDIKEIAVIKCASKTMRAETDFNSFVVIKEE